MGRTGTSMKLANQCSSTKVVRRRLYSGETFMGKYCYDNFYTALQVCHRMALLKPQYRYTLYECEHCGFIHIGRAHPKAILYMYDMVIPNFPSEPINLNKKTALSKSQKRKILKNHGIIPGVVKPKKEGDPYRNTLAYTTKYRGYRPFENLSSILDIERPHSSTD